MSKTKKVLITVCFHMETEVPDDWDQDMIRFHLEENTCNDNFVEKLHQSLTEDECTTCNISETLVGHIPFSEIKRIKKWMVLR